MFKSSDKEINRLVDYIDSTYKKKNEYNEQRKFDSRYNERELLLRELEDNLQLVTMVNKEVYALNFDNTLTPGSSGLPGGGSGSGSSSTSTVMSYVNLKATGQSAGDLHLTDANWAVSKAHITQIIVQTASTDWDLWILQNDNSYATDDANIPKIQLAGNANGNWVLEPDFDYEDEDASKEIHFYWVDNVGSDTVDIYVKGQELS